MYEQTEFDEMWGRCAPIKRPARKERQRVAAAAIG